jgi:mannose-6-phosphate isomerase-like protein (cupin superfamily)
VGREGGRYGHGMSQQPLIILPQDVGAPGAGVRGAGLVIQNWRAAGVAAMVAPLHVHHADDEAWHVISGALRFRLAGREFVAEAGSTVLVPAGVAHTFGNAGPEPSRYILIVPTRLDELISSLHLVSPAQQAEVYRRYDSELLE